MAAWRAEIVCLRKKFSIKIYFLLPVSKFILQLTLVKNGP
jgi:hypothetical protein